jgi:hypothetical protein
MTPTAPFPASALNFTWVVSRFVNGGWIPAFAA